MSKIGPEGERYLDGGVYDNAPVGFLRKHGYNKIIVVDISSMKGFRHDDDMSNLQKKLMEGFLTEEQVLALKQEDFFQKLSLNQIH